MSKIIPRPKIMTAEKIRNHSGTGPRQTIKSSIRSIDGVDRMITGFMSTVGPVLLQYSIAIVFVWFGALKVLGMSPAQTLVENTVYWFKDPAPFVVILGYWEVLIGLTMCIRPLVRISILLLFLQMPGTFLPLVLLPGVCFTDFPFGLTLEGQYIVKNLVLISAALVIGGTLRSRRGARYVSPR